MTRNLIDFVDITHKEFDELYRLCADIMKKPDKYKNVCVGKVLANLFYEPSTRTNLSFRTAMYKLGGSVIGFSDPGSSSVAKGESLKDTIVMMSNYADLIVIRNPMEGAARAASLYSRVPVINAGDGGHLHPTQTLADLTTIRMHTGGIKNLNVGICGDLMNGRTVHSLIKALSGFPDIRFYFISPRELKIPDYIRYFLDSNKQKYIEITSLEATVSSLDVLYMTRIQRERFDSESEYERHRHAYILTSGKLSDAKSSLLIMHPLPRVDEISVDVDNDPRALYFAQARYGMYIRMALIMTMLKNAPAEPRETEVGGAACVNPRCVSMFEKYLPNLTYEREGRVFCEYCDKEI
ncbi:MAG: aspartate carbamoyltransferase [Clostridiales bacterium]|jgi:aspartate carbamoyltransferase catalytic subunit|nr:aspartate carbamoyltransferase [Clostridiales bacterium]